MSFHKLSPIIDLLNLSSLTDAYYIEYHGYNVDDREFLKSETFLKQIFRKKEYISEKLQLLLFVET